MVNDLKKFFEEKIVETLHFGVLSSLQVRWTIKKDVTCYVSTKKKTRKNREKSWNIVKYREVFFGEKMEKWVQLVQNDIVETTGGSSKKFRFRKYISEKIPVTPP